MRRLLGILASALPIAGMTGCAGLTGLPGANGAGTGASWAAAAAEIAKDPKCGHDDDVTVILGPVSSGTVKLVRHCPIPLATAQVAPTP